LQNKPLSAFLRLLDKYYQGAEYPVADGSGIKSNVDLIINCQLDDIVALNKELAKYGLQFKKGFAKLKVLVFKPI
jgi:hypothetical protein